MRDDVWLCLSAWRMRGELFPMMAEGEIVLVVLVFIFESVPDSAQDGALRCRAR